MNPVDPVRELLRQKGCPQQIIRGGLHRLVENWEKVVESVAHGYCFGLDDYLNDLDGRQLLEEALAIAPPDRKRESLERVRRADEQMRALIMPAGKCLWGDETAEAEGWTAEKNWWYFNRPIHAARELLLEIENI